MPSLGSVQGSSYDTITDTLRYIVLPRQTYLGPLRRPIFLKGVLNGNTEEMPDRMRDLYLRFCSADTFFPGFCRRDILHVPTNDLKNEIPAMVSVACFGVGWL